MDYTGTRRAARESESQFFREVGEAIIAQVHPTERDPLRSEIVSRWRLGGYRLAGYLLPTKKKRFPEELSAFLAGMHQRMQEYEAEHLGPTVVDPFDINACERLEARAHKYLKLATHPNTGENEARNAALSLAKMIATSELAILGWERVRHFTQKFNDLEQA